MKIYFVIDLSQDGKVFIQTYSIIKDIFLCRLIKIYVLIVLNPASNWPISPNVFVKLSLKSS